MDPSLEQHLGHGLNRYQPSEQLGPAEMRLLWKHAGHYRLRQYVH
jgi:hypothetical protein